jgi:hypothetical protein
MEWHDKKECSFDELPEHIIKDLSEKRKGDTIIYRIVEFKRIDDFTICVEKDMNITKLDGKVIIENHSWSENLENLLYMSKTYGGVFYSKLIGMCLFCGGLDKIFTKKGKVRKRIKKQLDIE